MSGANAVSGVSVAHRTDSDAAATGTTTLVMDYGGVLTNPLAETLMSFCAATSISADDLLNALGAVAHDLGDDPMALLETASITEAAFVEAVAAHLPGGAAALEGKPFGEWWFLGRSIDERPLGLVREARASGLRTALLTNNVVEWRPRWRAQLDVSSLFEVVVDSSEERIRKPDPGIYSILLERLGERAGSVLLVDDTEANCVAAREAGMRAILYAGPETLPEVRAAIGIGEAR